MPLPIILGIATVLATAGGLVTSVHGAANMKKANDIMKSAKHQHQSNIRVFEKKSQQITQVMDRLGKLELKILNSFQDFAEVIEKIQNKPEFQRYTRQGIELPKYSKETLTEVSVGASVLLGGLGGAAAGTASAIAAAGATTSAVMAFGTASTGTAIASLSGAAATNATLAAIGGGAIAAGGGGIALGTAILEATTFGVGLLAAGVIFNIAGSKISDKAKQAYDEMKKDQETINRICEYLEELGEIAIKYTEVLKIIRKKYLENFNYISYVVNALHKVEWNEFTEEEKIATENIVLLVGLLYQMCQVNLVLTAENEGEINKVNVGDISMSINHAKNVLENLK